MNVKLTIVIILILFVTPFKNHAQKHLKDTTIDGITYHYVSYYFNKKIKMASQSKYKKDGGEWIYFYRNGEEKSSGAYNKNGRKEGKWWYEKSEIIFYENGGITKMGKGCKGCPGF